MADEAPDISQQIDPSIIANLMAGIGTGKQPELANADSLQAKSGLQSAIQSAPTPSPALSVPGAQSQLPSQLVDSLAANQSTPMIKGGQTAAQAAGPPRPTIGGLPGLIADLINPGRNVAPGQLAPSKLDRFESFLGNFLQSLSAGFANEGHGPGAAMRGAAAAMQAPYQQALQQYGLGQQQQAQQAQIASEQAKTEQTRRQTEMMGQMVTIQTPSGPISMPYQIAMKAYPASVTGQYGVQKEEIKGEFKLEAEAIKTRLANGTASKFIPDTKDGRMFYHVFNKFGKEIGQADVNTIAQFTGKTTSTTELKQQEDGSYIRVPKVTMTQPIIPNRGGVSGSSGVPNASMPVRKSGGQYWGTTDAHGGYNKQAAVPVLDASGKPIFGKAPENIRTMAYTAQATLPHMDTILNEIDELDKMGLLGQFKGKMTNYLTGKGFSEPGLSADQRQMIGKFVNDVKLMDSAMLRTHFGARGGQNMYDKFSEMLNAGEDPDLMRGGLSSFRDYLTGYGTMINMHSSTPAHSGSGNRPPGW